jgi:hypothetical protein
MADALREVPSVDQLLSPEPLSQNYLQALQDSQPASVQNAPGPYTKSGSRAATQPASAGSNADTDGGEREQEIQKTQLRRAALIEEKVRICAPNFPTSHFGLLVSGERLLRFDAEGDSKAMKAFAAAAIRPGKVVKAKMRGVIIDDQDTVRVASIEIKGESELSQELIETSSLDSARSASRPLALAGSMALRLARMVGFENSSKGPLPTSMSGTCAAITSRKKAIYS